MDKTNAQNITITVYEIHPQETGITEINLNKTLFDALNETESVRARLMPLSSDPDNSDSDFIASFTAGRGYLFGSFARLTEGEESIVMKEQLNKKTVSLNEMISESSGKSEGSIKTSSFFCIHKTLLAVTHSRTTVRPLETYVNWLFKKRDEHDNYCCFVPKKNTAAEIPLRNIKSIQLGEAFMNAKLDTRTEIVNLKSNLFKKFLNDVKSVSDLNDEELLSAVLTLKFNKKKMKGENAKALDTALKIVDSEDVVITGKDGKRIRGTQFLVKAVRPVEKLKNGLFNEQEIESEMSKILKAVENGEVVS